MCYRYLAQQEGEVGYQEGEYIQDGAQQEYVHADVDGYHLVQPQDYDPNNADQVRALRIFTYYHYYYYHMLVLPTGKVRPADKPQLNAVMILPLMALHITCMQRLISI